MLIFLRPPFTTVTSISERLEQNLKRRNVRYKSMKGFQLRTFFPDCHGLPIEHKVAQLRGKTRTWNAELREECASFLGVYRKQRSQFISFGILADWANEYKTKIQLMRPTF
ncbi:MAG: class I tRNA ligase family protein [Bacilli bacterium]